MQDRMQGDSKVMDLLYAGVFGTLFPLFLFAARAFARRERGHEIADQVSNAFMALRPKYLEAVRTNMAQVTGLPLAHPEVERLAQRMVCQHARAWVDFFFFGQRPPEALLGTFTPNQDVGQLQSFISEGRGVILLTAHAGNYELGGLLLKALGQEIHAVYKPDRFPTVERLRGDLRRQSGVVGIPVDGTGFSTLPLVKLLREGKLVGMQGDRDFSLNGLPIPFFGREVHFPRGPWEVAAMTGAPIVTSFLWVDEEGRFRALFGEPIFIRGGRGERKGEIEMGMRRYAAELESFIRKDPSQWYCFYPFWDDPMRASSGSQETSRP